MTATSSLPLPPATFELTGPVASILIDQVEQSRIDLSRPERLEFEYMEQMDTVLSLAKPKPQPVRAVHVGGCGCALAWAWSITRPQSRQLAIEIDPVLADQVRGWLPLPRKPELRIRVGDGRKVLEESSATFDVLVRDAFIGRAVPGPLQTLEWNQVVRQHLRPRGLYLANAAHGGGADSRSDVSATMQTFPHVALIGESKVLKSARWGNLVIAAWDDPDLIDPLELDRRLRRLALPVQIFSGPRLNKWLGGRAPNSDPKD